MTSLRQQVLDGHIVASWHRITAALAFEQQAGILQERSSSQRKDPSFCTTSYAEAIDLADNGWAEGARMAEQHSAYVELFATAQTRTTSFGWDDTEGELNAERLLSGSDFYLRKSKRQLKPSRGCRILVSTAASAGVPQETMAQRAIDIAAGVWQLELAKHDVELWAIQSTSDGTQTCCIKVHETGQTINLAKVSFWCGHQAVLRRLIFGLKERASKEVQKKIGSGYGYPDGLSKHNLARLELPPWQGDTLVINTIRSSDVQRNRESIVKGFHKALQRLDDSDYDDSGIIEVAGPGW